MRRKARVIVGRSGGVKEGEYLLRPRTRLSSNFVLHLDNCHDGWSPLHPNLEDLAVRLEEDENYKVLRRIKLRDEYNSTLDGTPLIGIVLDVETTGLDPDVHEIIELAMIKFTFDRGGKIGTVIDTFQELRAPSGAFPEEISAITGITPEAVRGHSIENDAVLKFIEENALIVAHNAAFDRPFCEQLVPEFSEHSWACSATEIGWAAEGITGSRLEYVIQSFGRFYDAHRAFDDCVALLSLLSFLLPRSKTRVLEALLTSARRVEARVFAVGAPYELRPMLRGRGYRWNDGQNGFPRAWWRDVPLVQEDQEIEYLTALSSLIRPETSKMTAKSRFRRGL